MYLKRLEIHGFKSFASKTTMEFSQGIIAIVGPNGSGKSNVADSLRWVLGEQSAKIIRGKQSQDVIFAGSEKKTKLGFAEVTATFDNRDRRIPVDSAEVSIGRRIDRSGESEYLINGNRVRLLDIVDLVLKSNIGTSRYTVIGQGTIDQMILAGPSEIKNLLDEASGVKTYYIKREKTLRRLEQTAQNLMRAEDLLVEIEPRLKSLRRQAKRMEARVELEAELKTYQHEFFSKQYWEQKKHLDQFVLELGHFSEQRSTLEEQVAAIRQRLDSSQQQGSEQSKQYRIIQQQLETLQSQKNKFLEDLSLVRGKMQSQKTASAGDPQTLTVELHDKTRSIEELVQKIKTDSASQQALEHALDEQKKSLDQLTEKLNKLYAGSKNPVQIDWSLFDLEFKSLESVFLDLDTKLESAHDVSDVKSIVALLRSSFGKFKTAIKETVRNPENSLEKFQQEMEAALKHKDEVSAQVSSLELNVSRSKMSLEFLQKEKYKLEQEKLHLDLELKKAQSSSSDDFWKQLLDEESRIQKEVEALAEQITLVETSVKDFYELETNKQKQHHEAEMQLRTLQDQIFKLKDQEAAVGIEKARVDTQMQALIEDTYRALGEDILKNIQEKAIVVETQQLEEKISKLKSQLDMIGGMDELTLKEYQETDARYTNLTEQIEDLKKAMNDLRSIMDELDGHIKQKFNEAFHKINERFEHYFRILFNGGRAYLSVMRAGEEEKPEVQEGEESAASSEIVETLRPEEKVVQKYEKGVSNIVGIDIKATPPNKKLASIQALSGGERALTSIALLCSLLACFPSPFVVLDEVDAALDDANTIRFGQILGTLAHQTQFITITHNRETMAQANILYGVTMGDDGISKLLSVKLEQAKQFAK